METIKLRKEIREALKEEGYQGNELKEKIEEWFNQELLMRQEKADERRALELKRINQEKSSDEKIRLCNQYIYEIQERQRKRKLAERFSELEQKEVNELKYYTQNKPILNIVFQVLSTKK